MKNITIKNIFSNLLKVIFIIAFVVLYSKVFGSINTLTGISILVALMTFWCIDIGINKKQAPFIIILLFLLTGLSNRLAMFNPVLGLIINFTTAFLITYIPSNKPEYKAYMAFILCFIFNESNPVTGHAFFIRMLSLLIGSFLVAGVYFFRHRKSDLNYDTIQKSLSNINITSDRFIISIKMALGVSIAMLIGTLLDLKRTMWIAISVMSLTQIDFEQTKIRFKNRILSTVIGSIVFVVLFQLLIPDKYVFIVSLILSYIYSFLVDYKYQVILITVSSLSSALAIFDTSTAIGLRIGLIIIGCILGYLINKINFKKLFQTNFKDLLQQKLKKLKSIKNNKLKYD